MKTVALLLRIAAAGCVAAGGVAAEHPGIIELKPPKGVELDAAQRAELDRANRHLRAAYAALEERNDLAAADRDLRIALTIQRRIMALKPDIVPAGIGDMIEDQGTPVDRIESSGGAEKLLEIGAYGGQSAPDAYDYQGLHLRRMVKDGRQLVAGIAIRQAEITATLKRIQLRPGPGTGKRSSDAKPPAVQVEILPDDQAAASRPERSGEPPRDRQAPADGAKDPAGAQPTGDATTADPADVAQQPDGTQRPKRDQPQAVATMAVADGQPAGDMTSGDPTPLAPQPGAARQAKRDDRMNTDAAQEPAAVPPTGGATEADPAAVAQQQDAVAAALRQHAAALREQRDGQGAAAAFEAAAHAAEETADRLRAGEVEAAAAASRDTERLIAAAKAGVDQAGAAGAQQAVAELGERLSELQRRQDATLAATRELARGGGAGADEETRRERATALMLEQGRLKRELDATARALKELGRALGDGEAGEGDPQQAQAERAARDGLEAGAKALKDAKAVQHAVDAAIALKDGELTAAAEAMAQVGAALQQARAGAAKADQALSGGGEAQLRRGLEALREVSTDLRRLARAADAAAGTDGEPADGRQPGAGRRRAGEPAGADGRPGGAEPTAAGESGEEVRPGAGERRDDRQLSPTLAKALQAQSEQLAQRLADAVSLLGDQAPEDARAAVALALEEIPFTGDLDRSLAAVERLVARVEALEGLIGRRIGQDQQARASRSFLKDPVPSAYRQAVADYLNALSADEPGRRE